jgi:hypothetical protein
MAPRYQSPPNWPPPPTGWTPPPGWQPDPAWGPPPQGWQFWTTSRTNRGAWGWSFLSAAVYYVLLILVLTVSFDTFNPEVAGELLVSFVLGGAVVGLVAWLMSARWPLWLYPIVVPGAVLAFRVVSVASQLSSTS